MSETSTLDHVLAGCRPVPLASYLKALAVLRLVAEQIDPAVRGAWQSDRFVLRTQLGGKELTSFFLDKYVPSPIIAPWNGGSGFYPKDNKTALEGISSSKATRFARYREAVAIAERLLSELEIVNKPDADAKRRLLQECRGAFPDSALEWLDAAVALTNDKAKYPPLLGTGGNDGRLDFTNNFMQRLADVIDPTSGQPRTMSAILLGAALFDETASGFVSNSIGQFSPGSAGGANAASGFDGSPCFNPWDFVLMLEGAIAFAVATVRKLDANSGGALSAPFTVRPSGVGYASSSVTDETESRGEMWLPLWSNFTSYPEIRHLFAEGRAAVGKRQARTGVDFARAVASLGVDRGITQLQRYGFHVRNGLAYLATPLDRWVVASRENTVLLQQIDSWLDRLRGRARGDTAPASVRRAALSLDESIMAMCRDDRAERVQAVLVALGAVERALARSNEWAKEAFIKPLPLLDPTWLERSNDGSVEFRLAVSLASVAASPFNPAKAGRVSPLREHVEPVCVGRQVTWLNESSNEVAWFDGDLVSAMGAMLSRRVLLMRREKFDHWPDGPARGVVCANLADIAEFIEGRVDDSRLEKLFLGALLTRWTGDRTIKMAPSTQELLPSAGYELLKLAFAGSPVRRVAVPIVPQVARLALAGRGTDAIAVASRRLRASSLVPVTKRIPLAGHTAKRTAAALLFPVGMDSVELIARRALRGAVDSRRGNATGNDTGDTPDEV